MVSDRGAKGTLCAEHFGAGVALAQVTLDLEILHQVQLAVCVAVDEVLRVFAAHLSAPH
jgi:hypothetical protein